MLKRSYFTFFCKTLVSKCRFYLKVQHFSVFYTTKLHSDQKPVLLPEQSEILLTIKSSVFYNSLLIFYSNFFRWTSLCLRAHSFPSQAYPTSSFFDDFWIWGHFLRCSSSQKFWTTSMGQVLRGPSDWRQGRSLLCWVYFVPCLPFRPEVWNLGRFGSFFAAPGGLQGKRWKNFVRDFNLYSKIGFCRNCWPNRFKMPKLRKRVQLTQAYFKNLPF